MMGSFDFKEAIGVDKVFTKTDAKKALYVIREIFDDKKQEIIRGTAFAFQQTDSNGTTRKFLITSRIKLGEGRLVADRYSSSNNRYIQNVEHKQERNGDLKLTRLVCQPEPPQPTNSSAFDLCLPVTKSMATATSHEGYTFKDGEVVEIKVRRSQDGTYDLQPNGLDMMLVQGAPLVRRTENKQNFYVEGVIYVSDNGGIHPILFQDKDLAQVYFEQRDIVDSTPPQPPQPPPLHAVLPQQPIDVQQQQHDIDTTLQILWNSSIDFRDELCKSMDFAYENIKYWSHLAGKFRIEKETYDLFSSINLMSPSEGLFDYLQASFPRMTVRELRAKLQNVNACEANRIFEGISDESCLLSKFLDEKHKKRKKLLIALDKDDVWKDVAEEMNIPLSKYAKLAEDTRFNPMRNLLDILVTQRPSLTIGNLRLKLQRLPTPLHNVVAQLGSEELEDQDRLKKLLENPTILEAVETILNKTDGKMGRWEHLAEMYIKEDEIVMCINDLRPHQSSNSPTNNLIEYVMAHQPEKHKVAMLIVHLGNIRRFDGVEIVAKYIKGGWSAAKNVLNGAGIRIDPGDAPNETEPRSQQSAEQTEGPSNSTQELRDNSGVGDCIPGGFRRHASV